MIRKAARSRLLVAVGGWLQGPPQAPKSTGAQVPPSAPGPASVETTSAGLCRAVVGRWGGRESESEWTHPVQVCAVQTGKRRANETKLKEGNKTDKSRNQ